MLATLPLQGQERVLDAGAGTGRDTAALLDRLPRGHVVAVDGSSAMLAQLRTRLAGVDADRLTALEADLREPLRLGEPADAVFSVATLHWLPDHDAVFGSLAAVLRPGGLLRAEWGGEGNLASVESALSDVGLRQVRDSLAFAAPEQTAERLRAAGFVDVEVQLAPDPVRLQPGVVMVRWLYDQGIEVVVAHVHPAHQASMAVARASDSPLPTRFSTARCAGRAGGSSTASGPAEEVSRGGRRRTTLVRKPFGSWDAASEAAPRRRDARAAASWH